MSKSPAFQFYPDDFMGGKPGMMTPEQTHVYVWLLCMDWNQNGFTLDVTTLARWCRVTPAVFRKAWSVVQDCFSSREGRWFNERLEKERTKQAEWREKSSKGGRTKGQPKANHPSENDGEPDLANGSSLVDENNEPKGNTPVSVSSLQTPVIKTTTSPPPDGAGAEPPKKSGKSPPKYPHFDTEQCGRLYETWITHRGAIEYSAFRKALGPLYEVPEPPIEQEMHDAIVVSGEYVQEMDAKDARFETIHTFAGGIHEWVRLGKLPTAIEGILTERGNMAGSKALRNAKRGAAA